MASTPDRAVPLTADTLSIDLHATTDAREWTAEFDRIYPDRRPDSETMLGWFANAIEVGRMADRAVHPDALAALREALDKLYELPTHRHRAPNGADMPQDCVMLRDVEMLHEDALAAAATAPAPLDVERLAQALRWAPPDLDGFPWEEQVPEGWRHRKAAAELGAEYDRLCSVDGAVLVGARDAIALGVPALLAPDDPAAGAAGLGRVGDATGDPARLSDAAASGTRAAVGSADVGGPALGAATLRSHALSVTQQSSLAAAATAPAPLDVERLAQALADLNIWEEVRRHEDTNTLAAAIVAEYARLSEPS